MKSVSMASNELMTLRLLSERWAEGFQNKKKERDYERKRRRKQQLLLLPIGVQDEKEWRTKVHLYIGRGNMLRALKKRTKSLC